MSAANSRARTAACDWLGDEGIGAGLLDACWLSGDPRGNEEDEAEELEEKDGDA